MFLYLTIKNYCYYWYYCYLRSLILGQNTVEPILEISYNFQVHTFVHRVLLFANLAF